MTEQQVQSKIIKRLKSDGWLVIKTIKLSEAGYPDIFCFRSGITMFVEVKTDKGKASALQEYRISELTKKGFKAFICYGYEDFLLKYQD